MEQLIKIVIIGDSGVGKSSIIVRFADNKYDDYFLPTIGLEFSIKKITIDDNLYKIHMWDLAGQERFRSITTSYYRNAQGILLAFDIANLDSFKNVEKWLFDIYKYSGDNTKIILIGTKSDLETERKISRENAEKFAKSINVSYYEISSKTNININEVFEDMVKQIKITIDIEKEIVKEEKNKFIRLHTKTYKKCCQ